MKTVCERVEEMIGYKESLGYSRGSYEKALGSLSSYLDERFPGCTVLTREVVGPWCSMRDTESANGYRRRMGTLREFTKYLSAVGACDFVLDTGSLPRKTQYTPHIFTDGELAGLLGATDGLVAYDGKQPARHLIVPVIYRLIYCCGLRPNEGREMLAEDVDPARGTIRVRKNKAHSERVVPMASDVAEMCGTYLEELGKVCPGSAFLFPSPSGRPYSGKWLMTYFLRAWDLAKPEGSTARVRVYDLRHRFATAVMARWLAEGRDLTAMLPYLSEYMGHSCIEHTLYYVHLLPEHLVRESAVDWERFNALVREVGQHE